MCILCTDPSCQNWFILTVHWISSCEAVLLDQSKVWKLVLAALSRTRNIHFLKRPRLLSRDLIWQFLCTAKNLKMSEKRATHENQAYVEFI